jgi:hypothetical protein
VCHQKKIHDKKSKVGYAVSLPGSSAQPVYSFFFHQGTTNDREIMRIMQQPSRTIDNRTETYSFRQSSRQEEEKKKEYDSKQQERKPKIAVAYHPNFC